MISDISTSNIGEKLTFFQLFTEKKWSIEVPIIQRDYAQGRESAKVIRDTFLGSLKEHLDSEQNIDLDFVYGSLSEGDNTTFIPLDGQQRLTTLFLLHWYLGLLDGQKALLNSFLLEGNKSKFSYKIRTSSSEFCDALLSKGVDLNALLPDDNGQNNSLSKTIQDSEWYFSTWGNDPTIQSMLTMLDAIHEKYNTSKGYFRKLTDTGKPIITFQFLNLEEFKLTDDLYIKMNARGKQLTSFENFKANLEQHISDLKDAALDNYKLISDAGEVAVSIRGYFSHKIDTDWANLFWEFRNTKDNTYDVQLMNFIRVVVTNYFVLNASNDDFISLRSLIGKDDANEKDQEANPISFAAYNFLGCLKREAILNLISILDVIEKSGKLKTYLLGNMYYNEDAIFREVIKNQLNYTERLQFYAFYQFLIENNSDVGLEEWIRVIHNLTENSIYNNAEQFARSLKSVQSLLPYSVNIMDYLSDATRPVNGFIEIQIKEERIKAHLLKKDDDWSLAVLKIEKHEYFKGQIGFILDFSGIERYYQLNQNCNWSITENSEYLRLFNEYADKASAVFGPGGLRRIPEFDFNRAGTWDKRYLWERALLTKGSYVLYANSNCSFLIDGKDRDISWKSLLRDENGGRRLFVKNLFDDDTFDASNLYGSLRKIIEAATITDWRKHFVEGEDIFDYLGSRRQMRWENEQSIYLLEKMRMSGPHAEYYSYAFFKKEMEGKDFAPFSLPKYFSVSGDEDDPCAYVDDWNYLNNNYGISVYGKTDTTLELSFYNANNGPINDEISLILTSLSFRIDKTDFRLVVDFAAACNVIEILCVEFQKLLK